MFWSYSVTRPGGGAWTACGAVPCAPAPAIGPAAAAPAVSASVAALARSNVFMVVNPLVVLSDCDLPQGKPPAPDGNLTPDFAHWQSRTPTHAGARHTTDSRSPC